MDTSMATPSRIGSLRRLEYAQELDTKRAGRREVASVMRGLRDDDVPNEIIRTIAWWHYGSRIQ